MRQCTLSYSYYNFLRIDIAFVIELKTVQQLFTDLDYIYWLHKDTSFLICYIAKRLLIYLHYYCIY